MGVQAPPRPAEPGEPLLRLTGAPTERRSFAVAATVAIGTTLALLALAWTARFVLDDAFISYRYAAHHAAGHGLVWNVGEAVEGYTNFLWTWLLALAMRAGLEPIATSHALGLACHAATLLLVFALAHRLAGSLRAGLGAQVALGTCYTVAAYATSGLETAMQAMWPVAACALVVLRDGPIRPGRALTLSLVLAAAVLTRLDSAVLAAWPGLAALVLALREPRGRVPTTAALVLPFGIVVGGWLVWKVGFYGDLLPNTFHAKAAAEGRFVRGLAFVAAFFTAYLLWPALALAAFGARGLDDPARRPLALAAAAVALWIAYVAWVGGDFMEFRFLVAAAPWLYLLIVVLGFRALARWPLAQLLLVVALAAGSARHAATFEGDTRVESIPQLASHLVRPEQDWAGVGRHLGAVFAEDRTVRIATTAAGAIPYLSGLPAVDQLGLTDHHIAHHGGRFGAQVGHDRIASVAYLREREVHLVLGQPWIVRPSPAARTHYSFRQVGELRTFPGERADAFPPSSAVLEIPIAADRSLVALYLTPHPAVDRAAKELGWRRFGIVAPGPDARL